MTGYPPGLRAHDVAVWDLLMADHKVCTVVSRWDPARQAVVDRCFCGAEWSLPTPQVRVTVTVFEPAALEAAA